MYKAREQKEILAEMLGDSRAKTGVFEGTFQYDALASNSIEVAKLEVELEQSYKAAFADTAWNEYLTMRSREYGIERKAATKAVGKLTVTGSGRVPAGSLFSTQSGIRFLSLEDVEIDKSGEINIKAAEPGASGNVAANAITEIPMSIPGISAVSNPTPTYDGFDEETDASLSERYLFKVRNPATSGNKNNYILWAREVEGVGDARCIPIWNGPGTVKVIIIDDNHESASVDLVRKVYDHIEAVRPIGATLTVVAATPVLVNVAAKIIGEVDETEFRKSVNAYFTEIGFNSGYVSIARVGKLLLECTGVKDYDDLLLNGQSENIPLTEEELPAVGGVTFEF